MSRDLSNSAEAPGASSRNRSRIRAAGEKNLWLVGGGNLVAQFARRGLLDELLLGLMPVVLGGGIPLLPALLPGLLELKDVTRFGRGALALRYELPHGAGGTSVGSYPKSQNPV